MADSWKAAPRKPAGLPELPFTFPVKQAERANRQNWQLPGLDAFAE
jgi:hypothetical protein